MLDRLEKTHDASGAGTGGLAGAEPPPNFLTGGGLVMYLNPPPNSRNRGLLRSDN